MKGSITKRGHNRYLIRLTLGKDENGRRITKSHTVHGPKKLAEAVKSEMVAKYEGVSHITEEKGTLNAFLLEWLRHKQAQDEIGESTAHSYATNIRVHIAPGIGKLPLARVTTADIRDLYATQKEKGLQRATRGISHTILLQAFEHAIDDRRLTHNPASKAKGKSKRKRREPDQKVRRSFTPDQAHQFLNATEGFDHTMFITQLVTGCRVGELLGLTRDCILWDEMAINIDKAMAAPRGRDRILHFSTTKTVGSDRRIMVPQSLLDELRTHLDRLDQMRHFAGDDWEATGQGKNLVFPGPNGGFIPPETIRARFKATLKRAGLPREFRLYDCRHTMATLLLLENENIKVVSERLGHANVRVTLDYYVHVLPSMQKRAAEVLGQMFFPGSSNPPEST